MDNELLYAKIEDAGEQTPFGPQRGRDDKPSTLALLCLLLWSGARCTRVEDLARQRLSLSQRDAAEHERPSTGPVAHVRRGTGRSYPPANRCLPPSRRGYRKLWRDCALLAFARAPAVCDGDARERLARAASR